MLSRVEELPPESWARALAHLVAAPPELADNNHDSPYGRDFARAVAVLAAGLLRRKEPPPNESARFLLLAQRKAVVAELDDATIAAITERFLPIPVERDFHKTWLAVLLPRYAAAAGHARVLALAHPTNRPDVYGVLDDAALIEPLLDEPESLIDSCSAIFSIDEARTVACLENRPLALLVLVARAVQYQSDPLFVHIAKLAAARTDVSPAEVAEYGGLLLTAATVACELGDLDAAERMQKRIAKLARPFSWRDSVLEASDEESLTERLGTDRKVARAELLEKLADGDLDFSSDSTRYRLWPLVGADVKELFAIGGDRGLARDINGRWWLIDKAGATQLGASPGSRAARELGETTAWGTFEAGWMLRDARFVVVITRRETHLIETDAWASLGTSPGDATTFSFTARSEGFTEEAWLEGTTLCTTRQYAELEAKVPPACQEGAGTAGLLAWLCDKIRTGARVCCIERDLRPERLRSWLRDIPPADWLKVPHTLESMGFPAGTLTVTTTPVSTEELAALAPESHEDELDELWRAAGALRVSTGTAGFRLLTPQEVQQATPIALDGSEGTFRNVAVDHGERPVLMMRVDDGSLLRESANDTGRYAVRTGKSWDFDNNLVNALWTLCEPSTRRLSSLVGAARFDEVRLDEQVTLKKPKPTKRHKSTADAWKALKKWLEANEVDARPARAATAKATAAFVKQFKWAPKALLDALATHDGDDESGIFGGWSMLSMQGIASEYGFWTKEFASEAQPPEDEPALARTWWHERWLPVASSGGGDFLALDCTKEGKGRVFLAMMDPPFRRILAPSFDAWLVDYVHALESGAVTYDGDWCDFVEFIAPAPQ